MSITGIGTMHKFLIFLSLLGLLTSCQKQDAPSVTTFSGHAMTINYRIMIGQSLNDEEITLTEILINDTFQEINLIYNKWNPASEISYINQLPPGSQHVLSPGLHDLFQQTNQIVVLTQGRFDPTIKPLQDLWKTKLEKGEIPSQEEINSLQAITGWHHLHFDSGILTKDHPAVQVDLGGIAKGLCVDLLVQRLNAKGYPHVYVEWGGEIRASGHHPAQRPWTIYISRLGDNDPTHAIATIPLNNQAIATSGDYMQYWTIKSTTYSHIIDPKSGTPLTVHPGSIASASIVADSCLVADALATAVMLFDNENEAKEWLEQVKETYPSLAFWIVPRD